MAKPNKRNDQKLRSVTLPHGIPEDGIGAVRRQIPADEPPPWPVNAELAVVGKPTPRLDGELKVTGGARYTADIQLPGMLYARRIVSPHPHARIRSVDTTECEKHSGVKAVHIMKRELKTAKLEDASKELKSDFPIVRYAGQPIGAVAAVSQAAADEAAALVKVEYEILPFVVDMEVAEKPGAPSVYPAPASQAGTAGGGGGPSGIPLNGNVRGPVRNRRNQGTPEGDVKQGFADADVVVEAEFRTQVQTHSPMETHGVVADYKPDGLTVYASTQGTKSVRKEIADLFELPLSKIRVVTEFMGGGFGAKFGIGNYGMLAVHLSKKTGAPVRLMLDRKEEHLSVGNRPSSRQKLKIGAKKDGTLTAVALDSVGTAGTGTGSGTGAPAFLMYKCVNTEISEADVFINAGPAAAFRAPGHPQGCFALEQVIDEIAEKLGMDPLALRDKIDVDEKTTIDSQARRVERKLGADMFGWSKRRPPASDTGPIKRGVGMAQAIWYRFVDLDSGCTLRLGQDGSVELMSAVQDIGTGIRTALGQVAAEELGLRPEDVAVRIGDTAFPNGPNSGGSQTTGGLTPAVRDAAHQIKNKLIDAVANATDAEAKDLTVTEGRVRSQDGKIDLPFRNACKALPTEFVEVTATRKPDYGGFERDFGGRGGLGVGGMGGVQFVEVEVDTETGIINVERIVAVHDCGRPINPLGVESQIQGGILQGISYALFENRILDSQSGHMVNPTLDTYKILGSRETPQINVRIIEQYHGRSNTDAGGIGEPATVPTAAAIANAFYNATGKRVRELPMTPDVVLNALGVLG